MTDSNPFLGFSALDYLPGYKVVNVIEPFDHASFDEIVWYADQIMDDDGPVDYEAPADRTDRLMEELMRLIHEVAHDNGANAIINLKASMTINPVTGRLMVFATYATVVLEPERKPSRQM